MIIKLTVEDNDYTNLLHSFVALLDRRCPLPQPASGASIHEFIKYSQCEKRWNEIYLASQLPDTEKDWMCETIKAAWNEWVKNDPAADYLKQYFQCAFVDSITGTWENGENFYYFPQASVQKYICL